MPAPPAAIAESHAVGSGTRHSSCSATICYVDEVISRGGWMKVKPKQARYAQLRRIILIAALLAILALSVYVAIVRPTLEEFEGYGYAGIFLIQFLSTSSIAFPAPGFAAVVAFGALFDPFWTGIAAGLGGAAGEAVAYLAGYAGSDLLGRNRFKWVGRLQPLLRRHGFIVFLLLTAIPNPIFDVVGVAGGFLRYPLKSYMVAVTIGSLVKNFMYAYLGLLLQEWLPWA